MKVCMLAPEFIPVWGGVGTYTVELVRHMPKDVEIHVVTPFRERIGKSDVSSREYDFSKYFGCNVHVHFMSRASDTFFYNAKFQYSVARHLPKLLKDEKIDVVHSHTAHMPDLLLSFAKVEIPKVTTVHTTIKGQRAGTRSSGMSFWALDLSEKMTFLGYPLLRLIEDLYFIGNRHYVTVSYWMRDQLLKHYPRLNRKKIYVIHNAVDVEFFSPMMKRNNMRFNDGEVVLFTGRLTAAKGINILIEAIPKILKEHQRVTFLFIGPGDPSLYTRKLESKGVSKSKYSFLGYVKHREDLVNYYRMADVYVAPTFYENLPIRVLEAMACGIPVVATNVCAIPEAVSNNADGFLIPAGSVNDFVDAVLCLLKNPDLRKKMGENARNKVLGKFSWNVAAKKTSKVYEDVLSDMP